MGRSSDRQLGNSTTAYGETFAWPPSILLKASERHHEVALDRLLPRTPSGDSAEDGNWLDRGIPAVFGHPFFYGRDVHTAIGDISETECDHVWRGGQVVREGERGQRADDIDIDGHRLMFADAPDGGYAGESVTSDQAVEARGV